MRRIVYTMALIGLAACGGTQTAEEAEAPVTAEQAVPEAPAPAPTPAPADTMQQDTTHMTTGHE